MDIQINKSTGIYLMLGSLLMVITMVFHPVGGSFEQLLQHSSMAIISHSIAVFSLPFSGLGFLGLSKILEKAYFFSRLAFAVMVTGLIAAMLAATVNGLVLPLFANRYRAATQETLEAIRPFFHYNQALNHAFDYILIGAMFLSVVLWSVAIIRTQALPRWTGYLGILLVVIAILSIASGFYFLDLYGFRFFIGGWVLWISCVAIFTFRIRPDTNDGNP